MARVQIKSVIVTEDRVGQGKDKEDPIRMVFEMYTLEGTLLLKIDPCGSFKDDKLHSKMIYYNENLLKFDAI